MYAVDRASAFVLMIMKVRAKINLASNPGFMLLRHTNFLCIFNLAVGGNSIKKSLQNSFILPPLVKVGKRTLV